MRQTVIYVSSCAMHADGTPDTFLLQELPWLRRRFDRVLVCSGSGIAEITEDRPAKLAPAKPAFGGVRAVLSALFDRECHAEIRHLRADRRLTLQNALKLIVFNLRGRKLQYWIQALIRPEEHTTVYSYWMSYDGYAAALCKRKNPTVRAIARAHAFDIDIRRNPMNPYLMKRFMVKTLDVIYPINQTARAQIEGYVSVPPEKLKVIGAGSAGAEAIKHFTAPRFADHCFHVVSCSAMVEIKQIPLLIDVLAMWKQSKLHWVHIGGGPQEDAVRTYAEKMLNENPLVTYSLPGALAPERVAEFYQTTAFDVFVNTSRNEGTPVAIMEAMHEGIPVVAPAVGGIPELVTADTGCLYPQNGTAEDVLQALETVYAKTPQEAEQMSVSAQRRWNEECRIANLLPKLFPARVEEGGV